MNKICTSLEQSKKLIELGIDRTTADMYYSFDYNINEYDEDAQIIPKSELGQHFSLFPEDIPAWSLTALLGLMPPYLFEFERGIDLNIYRNLNGKGWHCSYMPNNIESMKKDKFKQITNGDNPVDAAFEMICWLLENKKL